MRSLIEGVGGGVAGFFFAAIVHDGLFSSVRSSAWGIAVLLAITAICGATWRWPVAVTRLARRCRPWLASLVLIVGVVLVASALAAALSARRDGSRLGGFEACYVAAQFVALNADPHDYPGPWATIVSILAPLLFLLVAVQGITLLFRDAIHDMRLRSTTGHVVVCGVGRIGRQLVEDLLVRRDSPQIVVVEQDPEHIDLPWLRENGISVVVGRAQRGEVLDEARVHLAKEVFVVTGSDEVNVECVVEIQDRLRALSRDRPMDLGRHRSIVHREVPKPLKCFVHLRDRDLSASMRERLEQPETQAYLDVEVFNATERTVRRLLEDMVRRPGLLPMNPDEVAHFVIIGFGEFGQGLALSLAELGHFPNVKRLRMTIADIDMEPKARRFLSRYSRFTAISPDSPIPWWTPFRPGSPSALSPSGSMAPAGANVEPPWPATDEWKVDAEGGIAYVCNARFADLADASQEQWVERFDNELTREHVKPIVFVCFDDDRVNFKVAERLRGLRNRLGSKAERQGYDRWPVFVWIPSQRELSSLLDAPTGTDSSASGAKDSVAAHGHAGKRSVVTKPKDPVPFGHCFGAVSYDEVTHSWSDRLARLLKFAYSGLFACGDTPSAVPEEYKSIADGWRALAEDVPGMPWKHKASTPEGGLGWSEHEKAAGKCWDAEKNEAFRASDRSAAIHAVIKLASVGARLDSAGVSPPAGSAHGRTGCGCRPSAGSDGDTIHRLRQLLCHSKTITPVHDDASHCRGSGKCDEENKRMLRTLTEMEHYRWCAERLLAGWQYEEPAAQEDRQELKRRFRHWELKPIAHGGGSPKDNASIQVLLAIAASDRVFRLVDLSEGARGTE